MRILLLCLVSWSLAQTAETAPRIRIETSAGDILCELFPEQAPRTVATILGLATGELAWTDPATGEQVQRPFYDGLTFHRVIPGFMVQGGCPLGKGTGGPGFTFPDEINAASLGLDERPAFVDGRPQEEWAYMTEQVQKQVV
ncbi:MAG: peptidylprolyl isomerase, partial [Planctomycetota bacterium]